MKARVLSVNEIARVAAEKLEGEFTQKYQEALLEGAKQGIAFVMYTLELQQGWKEKRQQRLFDDLKSTIHLGASWLRPLEGEGMKQHLQEKYNIDLTELFDQIATRPDVGKK